MPEQRDEDLGMPPKILYHYTSFETLDKIIRTETLRLYGFNTMNDISEGRWIEHMIEESLQSSRVDGDTQAMFWKVYTINRKATFRYLFSLSADGNALNQWILHAQQGRGVSIGFSLANLRINVSLPAQLAYAFHSVGLFPVLYDANEQKGIVSELVGRLSLVASQSESTRMTVIEEIVPPLIRLAIAFKSDGFLGEHEWRIIDNPTPLLGIALQTGIHKDAKSEKESKYDVRGNTMRDFVEIKLEDILTKGTKDIARIIIGPDSSIPEQTVRDYLLLMNLKGIEVTKSQIPYRSAL